MLIPKESIQKMTPYLTPQEGRMAALRLDFNENLKGASPKVVEAVKKISAESYGCYPEYKDLNSALSQFFDVANSCIIPTNGSDEGIRSLFDVYVEKGDEVILLSPSYSMYELYAQVAGANIVWVPYRSDFSFPIDEVLQAIRPCTRLIALATPNNPTGTLISRSDLERIIEANDNMLVLIDEAYAPFAQMTHVNLATQYPNVFVTQTFSKAYGLAGLRIGVLISSKENIEIVSKILSPAFSVDCLAVAAALAAMQDKEYMQQYVKEVMETKKWFIEEMARLGFRTVPSYANFVLVYFGEQNHMIASLLAKENILVRARSDLEGFLRITIGTKEHMQRLVAIIDAYCSRPALIFDMDGVLVDESRSYRQCIVKTVEYFLGNAIDPNEVKILKQQGGYNNDYDCTQAILERRGLKICRVSIKEKFDTFYQDLKKEEQWLLDESVLVKLKENFRLGIFTGRPKKDAWDALKRFGKESLFEVVVTDDDVENRKPDPEGLFLACKQLGTKNVIYFGDSKDDAEAARRASVKFIGVEPADLERVLCQEL